MKELTGKTYISHTKFEKLNDEEKLEAIWNNIKFIANQIAEEKKIEKEKESQKKKEKTRRISIPLNYCRSYYELDSDKEVSYVEFYEQKFNGRNYIFDVFSTADKNYYVKVTDITNGYEEIDFDKFKSKYAQPTLFDFFNI